MFNKDNFTLSSLTAAVNKRPPLDTSCRASSRPSG